MADISILMLGGSQSGKTSFTLGMYADMRIGRQGVTLLAQPNVDLEMTDRWHLLKKGIDATNRFPAPTDDGVEIEISMLYAFQKFMSFSWFDYPGRALNKREASELGIDLEAKMREAQTVFIFLPADEILTYVLTGNQDLKTIDLFELNRLFISIHDRNESDEDRPSVVVVVTKYDILFEVVERDFASLIPGLKENANANPPQSDDARVRTRYVIETVACSLLHSLFTENSGFNVLISSATLGYELARNADTGTIDPQWMSHPLAFSYITYAETVLAQWRRQHDNDKDLIDDLNGRFLRIFLSGEIADARASLETAKKRIANVEQRLMLIRKLLPDWAPIYRNGIRVSGHDYGL